MPTGYTAGIEDGKITTLEQFALCCARAFGACVLMRDEPWDTPIPEKFEPSSYHIDEYEKARENLQKYEKMSIREATKAALKEFNNEKKFQNEQIQKANEIDKKYEEMLRMIRAWNPPTKEHSGLKKFMIEQIMICYNPGSVTEYYRDNEVQLFSGEQWKEGQIKKAVRDMNYHLKEFEKEKERCENRTQWIKDLRESLKNPELYFVPTSLLD